MSMTMHLYRINPNVTYNGYYLDNTTKKDFKEDEQGVSAIEKLEISLGAPYTIEQLIAGTVDFDSEAYRSWFEKQENLAWSDGDAKKHELFDITANKGTFNDCRGVNRMLKRIKGIPFRLFKTNGETHKYFVLDKVAYAQGWFLKKRFFKKEMTWVVCTTKEQMIHFFEKYVDFNNKKDTRGRETVDMFINAWEDGMLFECAW